MDKLETLRTFDRLLLNAGIPDHVKRFCVLMAELGIKCPLAKTINGWNAANWSK